MSLDEKSLGLNVPGTPSWTRRKFMQVGSAATLAAGSLAEALAATDPQHPEAHHSDPQHAAAAAQSQAATGSMIDVPFAKREPRIGIVGVGGRGTSLLKNILAADGQVTAICDIVASKAEHAASLIVAAGQPKPTLFTAGEHDYENMLRRDDVDFVIVATPWIWHAPVSLAAMHDGKDVAMEVPGVRTLEDCWKIVHTSEATRKHCMTLENCCYGYNETLILRMCHAGLFGDLLWGEGAYIHDLRDELFSNAGEGLWRRTEHTLRDGNLYPTHGLGPVANYMGVQRGDRFGYLVSVSAPQRGLDAWRKAHLDASDPRWKERYICGDMNTSIIKTAHGLTITVKHAVTTPHPYTRVNQIAGTKGIFEDYPPRIYFDGMNKDESYGTLDSWAQYQHPLWKDQGELAQKLGGHGGMDFIMIYRLLQCIRQGLPPDMDVYDSATLAAVAPLSVTSVSHGSAPVAFPDFTGGKWRDRAISAIATQS